MAPDDRFVAEVEIRVRYAETDAMGIVHHASYIVYFELGRTTYTRLRGHDYISFEQTGHYLAVSEIHARYLKPAHFDQVLSLCCWIEELKSRSIVFAYEIVDQASQEMLVTGQSKHICITREGQPSRLPEPWASWAGT